MPLLAGQPASRSSMAGPLTSKEETGNEDEEDGCCRLGDYALARWGGTVGGDEVELVDASSNNSNATTVTKAPSSPLLSASWSYEDGTPYLSSTSVSSSNNCNNITPLSSSEEDSILQTASSGSASLPPSLLIPFSSSDESDSNDWVGVLSSSSPSSVRGNHQNSSAVITPPSSHIKEASISSTSITPKQANVSSSKRGHNSRNIHSNSTPIHRSHKIPTKYQKQERVNGSSGDGVKFVEKDEATTPRKKSKKARGSFPVDSRSSQSQNNSQEKKTGGKNRKSITSRFSFRASDDSNKSSSKKSKVKTNGVSPRKSKTGKTKVVEQDILCKRSSSHRFRARPLGSFLNVFTPKAKEDGSFKNTQLLKHRSPKKSKQPTRNIVSRRTSEERKKMSSDQSTSSTRRKSPTGKKKKLSVLKRSPQQQTINDKDSSQKPTEHMKLALSSLDLPSSDDDNITVSTATTLSTLPSVQSSSSKSFRANVHTRRSSTSSVGKDSTCPSTSVQPSLLRSPSLKRTSLSSLGTFSLASAEHQESDSEKGAKETSHDQVYSAESKLRLPSDVAEGEEDKCDDHSVSSLKTPSVCTITSSTTVTSQTVRSKSLLKDRSELKERKVEGIDPISSTAASTVTQSSARAVHRKKEMELRQRMSTLRSSIRPDVVEGKVTCRGVSSEKKTVSDVKDDQQEVRHSLLDQKRRSVRNAEDLLRQKMHSVITNPPQNKTKGVVPQKRDDVRTCKKPSLVRTAPPKQPLQEQPRPSSTSSSLRLAPSSTKSPTLSTKLPSRLQTSNIKRSPTPPGLRGRVSVEEILANARKRREKSQSREKGKVSGHPKTLQKKNPPDKCSEKSNTGVHKKISSVRKNNPSHVRKRRGTVTDSSSRISYESSIRIEQLISRHDGRSKVSRPKNQTKNITPKKNKKKKKNDTQKKKKKVGQKSDKSIETSFDIPDYAALVDESMESFRKKLGISESTYEEVMASSSLSFIPTGLTLN